jgi:trehalose-6-phosphatase
MALEKIEVVDRIEVLENGCIQIRTATKIMEDNKQISCTFHRHVIAPGDDFSHETNRVKAVCAATHDEWTVDTYKAEQEAKKLSEG